METLILRKHQSDRLIFLGVLLFFLGLIVGLLVPIFANPRMGLSSHIEGVLNGIFLIILGLIWYKLSLSQVWLKTTFWLSVYGTFANWFGMLIAAVFNAGRTLTIAANGHNGPPIVEGIVSFFLITLSLAMLTICVLLLIGLTRDRRDSQSEI
jgi:hydroxylaminobenzene mutase